jgi:predicted DNA-binding helix-hairpin-helix protein
MLEVKKLVSLSSHMQTELESSQECQPVIQGQKLPLLPISEVSLPGGKKMKVLKTMLTSACERNCNYCVFRAGRNMRRQTFKPEELASTFLKVFKSGEVEGLFLSSGIIKGGIQTQDRLIDTADILRNKLGFRGYIHLKLMPGLEKDQLRRSMQLANRVSSNLEAANENRLPYLAPLKSFDQELLAPLKWAQAIRENENPRSTWNGRWASSITQFVVGPSGENDLELISTSEYLYKKLGLSRAYYSGFIPMQNTPFENMPRTNPIRQNRLYQSSFLLRDYGFSLEDMPFANNGNLPLNVDPKTAWAQQNLLHSPIEINTATKEQLLQIPGVGPGSISKIIHARKLSPINSINQLKQIGIVTTRMQPYILLNGHQPAYQSELFSLQDPISLAPRSSFPG